MKGFFTSKQTESKSRPDGKTYSCASCGLYKDCQSPRMKPFGNFQKGILNIGESPGEIEDQHGKPWQGKTGRLLQKTYRRLGIDLFEDCLNANAVNCRPINKEENRPPTNYEVDCCRKNVLKVIDEHQPKVIVILGGSALHSILGHRWKKDLGGISKWRGFTIPDKDLKAWVCPTFHPSYVSREEGAVEVIWMQDLEQAIKKVDEPLPRYRKPKIEIIEDLSILSTIKTSQVAIDYETTGLKPHAVGHRIVCAAVAYDENRAYVFMMPKSKQATQPFIDLLANPQIGKMSHNMKFEETWSVVRLRQPVQNWGWDSMQAAHVLDNRTGVTGLKFQVYVNFGIVDYASEVAPYLQAKDNNGNAINRIMELLEPAGMVFGSGEMYKKARNTVSTLGRDTLLEYCGLDAIYEYRLALIQQKVMNYDFMPF